MENILLKESVIRTIEIAVFGLFIAYQLVRKIVGGSGDAEEVIIGLLMLNLSYTLALGSKLARVQSDHNHLKTQFGSLAQDFKAHLKTEESRQ